MRKLIISLAAAGTALAVATPANAQYAPQPQPYGAPQYGYNNGHGPNAYGQVRALQARIDAVQYRIDRLDRRLAGRDRNRLRDESRNIEKRLRSAGRNGLNPYEANDIQARIVRLEQRVNSVAANRYGGYGYDSSYGYSNRDRDGRDDRYEDDQGTRRD